MDSKTKILTLDHADTIRNFVNYSDGIVKKDLTKYIDDNINSEATTRQNADNVLDTKIDTKISEEETARKNQCETLQHNIDSEATARQNADNVLDTKIDTKISEEATTRQNADNVLDTKIDTKISEEATTRQNADNVLDTKIAEETTARQNADNALDNRTKTLESSVDTLNGKVDTLEESYDNLTGEIDDINTQLKDELLIEINNKITTAKGEVSEEYNAKVEALTEELNALIAESVEDNQDKIDEIQLALSKLEGDTNQALSALDGLRRELQTGEIFTEGQLDEIIRTVMITDVTIDDNTVEVPNIFSKNIVSLIAKFGQINAANIVGGDISGHTVKSTNIISDENSDFNGKPTWELQNEGSGHLANGNIYWDNDGNVTFGEDVKLSWNNVTDAPASMSEERITEITNNAISTAKISASQIDTDNLVVKRLDTKPNEENALTTNQVRIQDNVITVTGSENNKPVLRVTGEKLNEEFNFSSDYLDPVSSSITFTKPNNPINVLLTNSPELTKELNIEVGSISLILPHEDIDNITSKIRLYSENGVPCTVQITSVTGATINSGSLNIGFRCCVEKNGVTIAEYKYNALSLMINNGKFDNYDGTLSTSKRIYVPFDTICEKKYYGGEYTKKIYLVINEGAILGADKINVNVDFWGNDVSNIYIPYYKKHLITEIPNMNIAKDGIRYFVDDYNYFSIDDDGYFTYYGPGKQYGFGVDMNGAWVVIGGKKFNVSNLNEQLETAANSAIANSPGIVELQTEIKGEDGSGGLKNKLNELDKFVKNENDGLAVKVNNLDNDLKSTSDEVGNLNSWKSTTVEPQLSAVTSRVEAVENNAAKLVNTSSNSFILRLFNNDSFNDTFNVYVVSTGKYPTEMKFKKYDTVHGKGTYKFFGEKFQFKLGDDLTSDTIIYLKAFTVTNSDGDQFLIEPYENTFRMGTDKEININGTKYTVSDVCAYMGEGLSIDSTIKVRITELNTGGTNIVDIKYAFLQ